MKKGGRPGKITPIVLAEASNLTCREIADKYGFKQSTVAGILKRFDPPGRKLVNSKKSREQTGEFFRHTYSTALI